MRHFATAGAPRADGARVDSDDCYAGRAAPAAQCGLRLAQRRESVRFDALFASDHPDGSAVAARSTRRLRSAGAAVWGAEPEMFGVVDGLVEQFGDVVVVEGVGDAAAVPLSVDEAEVAQHPQLVRDR